MFFIYYPSSSKRQTLYNFDSPIYLSITCFCLRPVHMVFNFNTNFVN